MFVPLKGWFVGFENLTVMVSPFEYIESLASGSSDIMAVIYGASLTFTDTVAVLVTLFQSDIVYVNWSGVLRTKFRFGV